MPIIPVRYSLVLSTLALIFSSILPAQTDTAGLFGVVKDATGSSVGNSKIRLRNTATGALREQTTNAAGFYQFDVLAPGEYELTVEADGIQGIPRLRRSGAGGASSAP